MRPKHNSGTVTDMVKGNEMEQRGVIARVRMGAGYLPGYGSHPGTGLCVAFIIAAGVAGTEQGFVGFVGGLFVGSLIFGPIWLAGCLGRADEYLAKHTP